MSIPFMNENDLIKSLTPYSGMDATVFSSYTGFEITIRSEKEARSKDVLEKMVSYFYGMTLFDYRVKNAKEIIREGKKEGLDIDLSSLPVYKIMIYPMNMNDQEFEDVYTHAVMCLKLKEYYNGEKKWLLPK